MKQSQAEEMLKKLQCDQIHEQPTNFTIKQKS